MLVNWAADGLLEHCPVQHLVLPCTFLMVRLESSHPPACCMQRGSSGCPASKPGWRQPLTECEHSTCTGDVLCVMAALTQRAEIVQCQVWMVIFFAFHLCKN